MTRERLPAPDPAACDQIAGVLETNRGLVPGALRGPFRVRPYRRGYLSTMYRVDAGAHPLLVAIKHHDHADARVQRELEVMRTLDGRGAPRVYLTDSGGELLGDPFLVCDLVLERLPRTWDRAGLEQLAATMVRVHTDSRLLALDVDGEAAPGYSLAAEFAEESSVIATLAPGELRDVLDDTRTLLETRVPEWDAELADDPVAYIHGDLPHSHFHLSPAGPVLTHWEFSRRSSPTRELGRTCTHLARHEGAFETLLAAYRALVPWSVVDGAIQLQRMLLYFYESIHVAFWLDRAPYSPPPGSADRALREAALVRLFIRTELLGPEPDRGGA